MVKKELPVLWSDEAKDSLKYIFNYVKRNSPDNAQKVKQTILKIAATLNFYPEKFPRDPFLLDSKRNFRFFPKWSYKIVYEVTDKAVIIIDVFHAKQHPDKLKKKD